MKSWSSELIGSFKFFPNRNEWKEFPTRSTLKTKVDFFLHRIKNTRYK